MIHAWFVGAGLARDLGAINLGQGFPDDPPPPALLDALTRAAAQHPHHYPPMAGLAELRDEASLRALTPPWADIALLAADTEAMGLCVYARCTGGEHDLAVRAFVGQPAQVEDAASGAANATLAAWLHHAGALPHADGAYVVSQGREVGHDARLELRVDADGDVWSGGQVQTVVRGELDWD